MMIGQISLMIFRFDVGDNIPRRPSQKFLFATKARRHKE